MFKWGGVIYDLGINNNTFLLYVGGWTRINHVKAINGDVLNWIGSLRKTSDNCV